MLPTDMNEDVTCPAQSKFALFQREMVAHLDEEETEVVPAMRRTFTQQEEQKVWVRLRKAMSDRSDRYLFQHACGSHECRGGCEVCLHVQAAPSAV